jgi:hypothetical protein
VLPTDYFDQFRVLIPRKFRKFQVSKKRKKEMHIPLCPSAKNGISPLNVREL